MQFGNLMVDGAAVPRIVDDIIGHLAFLAQRDLRIHSLDRFLLAVTVPCANTLDLLTCGTVEMQSKTYTALYETVTGPMLCLITS